MSSSTVASSTDPAPPGGGWELRFRLPVELEPPPHPTGAASATAAASRRSGGGGAGPPAPAPPPLTAAAQAASRSEAAASGAPATVTRAAPAPPRHPARAVAALLWGDAGGVAADAADAEASGKRRLQQQAAQVIAVTVTAAERLLAQPLSAVLAHQDAEVAARSAEVDAATEQVRVLDGLLSRTGAAIAAAELRMRQGAASASALGSIAGHLGGGAGTAPAVEGVAAEGGGGEAGGGVAGSEAVALGNSVRAAARGSRAAAAAPAAATAILQAPSATAAAAAPSASPAAGRKRKRGGSVAAAAAAVASKPPPP